jgi:hypothetical protein
LHRHGDLACCHPRRAPDILTTGDRHRIAGTTTPSPPGPSSPTTCLPPASSIPPTSTSTTSPTPATSTW